MKRFRLAITRQRLRLVVNNESIAQSVLINDGVVADRATPDHPALRSNDCPLGDLYPAVAAYQYVAVEFEDALVCQSA